MPSPGFSHLHVHSHYSLLDGLGQLQDICKATKDMGMDSIALTDHGVLYGAVQWYETAKEYGVKPIIGLEGYISPNKHVQKRAKIDARPYHVTLIAKNRTGYKNLIKLVTIAHLEGYYYKPRFDYETLAKYSEGLICLSGCVIAHIPREILSGNIDEAARLVPEYQKIFGRDNFYLEVQHHPNFSDQDVVNERIFEFGKKFEIPVAATGDVHLVSKDDESAHDILLCVQTGKKVQDTDRMSYVGNEMYLKSPEEMAASFASQPEVLENTLRIADQCTFDLELDKMHLPKFEVPVGDTPKTHLRKMCQDAVEARYDNPFDQASDEIKERIDYELGIIEKTGFSSYFLIVNDFVMWAKNNGIVVGPGRGSAAGSIVSYLLNITDVDPLKWELLFERFLNPARISPPDIDLDFDDSRRNEVIEYVAQKYGRDRVAQIITFGTIKARNGIRDAGRVLDVPYSLCDRIAKMVPMGMTLEEALANVSDLKSVYDTEPQAKQVIDSAKRLEGVARHAGTHACGVVIADEPLNELVPCQFSTRGGEANEQITTQYDWHDVEKLGLLKMDFLGLSNLTIIQHTLDLIEKRHGKRVEISDLPLDDAKTFELLREAKTVGVFQLESSGMRRYLKELQPTELEDIVSMVALYRPGPLEGGMVSEFINRKHGRKQVEFPHPKLEPILRNTYGVIVYQEQIMRIVRDLAGFSLGESDLLRKAVGKKIKSLLEEQRKKFMAGCKEQGVSEKVAREVFAFIEPFAGYGFNRSHAVCYAMIAYQTAYLKANYPSEFMAALLRSDEGNNDRLAIEIAECHHLDITVLPPEINQSYKHFTVINLDEQGQPLTDPARIHTHIEGVPAGIRFGLAAIKNLGSDAVEKIIEHREADGPYDSLSALVSRIPPQSLNKKSLEALMMSGALDAHGERAAMLATIPVISKFSRDVHQAANSNQMDLFGGMAERPVARFQLESVEAAPRMQRLKWEKDLLGLYVSEQPLSEHRELIEQHATPIGSIGQHLVNQRARIVGVVSRIHKITTRKGEPMLFVQIDDFSDNIEVLFFPSVLQEHGSLVEEDAILTLEGRVSDKDGTFKLLVDGVTTFDAEFLKKSQAVEQREQKRWPKKNQSGGNYGSSYSPASTAAPINTAPAIPAPDPLGPPPPDSIELMLESAFTPAQLKELKECLEAMPAGSAPVLLRIKEGQRERRIKTNYRIAPGPESLAKIERIVGQGKICA